MANRITRLKAVVQSAVPGICPERALLWTEYFRNRANRNHNFNILGNIAPVEVAVIERNWLVHGRMHAVEHAEGADPGAVTAFMAVLQDVLHERVILLHPRFLANRGIVG